MFYRSNPYRKDNPDIWLPRAGVAARIREAGAIGAACCLGLPRRAGARLYAGNDAEARWRGWRVTEYRGGLARRYRDERFDRGELRVSSLPPAGSR